MVALHGDKNQHERESVLSDFRSGRACILVATDIAARGLGKFIIFSNTNYYLKHYNKKKMFDTILLYMLNTRLSCTVILRKGSTLYYFFTQSMTLLLRQTFFFLNNCLFLDCFRRPGR